MPKPKLDPAREKRITREINVDAYDSGERALAWYYYLDGKLTFPFQARCVRIRAISPLKKGETVEVIGLAPEDDCMKEIIVMAKREARRLGLPLSQLEPLRAAAKTKEAVKDWQYWVEAGYAL